MKRLRRALCAGAFIAVVATVVVLADCAGDFLRTDSCLDKGGRWNDAAQTCEMTGRAPGFASSYRWNLSKSVAFSPVQNSGDCIAIRQHLLMLNKL